MRPGAQRGRQGVRAPPGRLPQDRVHETDSRHAEAHGTITCSRLAVSQASRGGRGACPPGARPSTLCPPMQPGAQSARPNALLHADSVCCRTLHDNRAALTQAAMSSGTHSRGRCSGHSSRPMHHLRSRLNVCAVCRSSGRPNDVVRAESCAVLMMYATRRSPGAHGTKESGQLASGSETAPESRHPCNPLGPPSASALQRAPSGRLKRALCGVHGSWGRTCWGGDKQGGGEGAGPGPVVTGLAHLHPWSDSYVGSANIRARTSWRSYHAPIMRCSCSSSLHTDGRSAGEIGGWHGLEAAFERTSAGVQRGRRERRIPARCGVAQG